MFIDFDKKNNMEDPKFKVVDHVRISKYKSIFIKGYVPKWEDVFMITKLKHTVQGHMSLVILKVN